MANGFRAALQQLAVRIAVCVVLMLTTGQAPQAAEPPGYWSCDGERWVAVGSPAHPEPIIACGGTVTGGGAVTEELCEAAGGTWGPIGLFPEPICSQRTLDAGRQCADMGECAASCDADLTREQYDALMSGETVLTGGFCSSATPLIGCHPMVEAGRVNGILCLD